eukprot:jgi/Botrbrau1/8376/Bobra.0046s0035.2
MTTTLLTRMSQVLMYKQHGSPSDVISLSFKEFEGPGDGELLVDVLAAPINPSDINTIEGRYPILPALPAVGGNEGVGVVRSVGSGVTGFAESDWVIPRKMGLGWWRSCGVFPAHALRKIPSDIPLEIAASLCVNPPSALLMLREFVELQEGDVVVQNGATSAVGQLVIQLARARKLRTVNIIREREGKEEAEAQLKRLGADVVTTEGDAKQKIREAGLEAGVLGLNCVGGSASSAVAKLLRDGATMVTYGGMSLLPVTVPTGLFIFKDLVCRGFWMSSKRYSAKKDAAIDELIQLARQGLLSLEYEKVALADFQTALQKYQVGTHGRKLLFVPTKQDRMPSSCARPAGLQTSTRNSKQARDVRMRADVRRSNIHGLGFPAPPS